VNPSTGNRERPTYQYAYDKFGNRVSIEDPLGHSTTFGFDALGNQVSETLPELNGQPAAIETTAYNSHGQLATSTDFKGQITAYGYDNLGRLTSKKFYASLADYQADNVADQTTYAYDIVEADGIHSTFTDSTGVTDTLYDAEGRAVKVTSPQGTIHYKYDSATGEHIETWTDNSDSTCPFHKRTPCVALHGVAASA
jgi:YD repeat-containing protein